MLLLLGDAWGWIYIISMAKNCSNSSAWAIELLQIFFQHRFIFILALLNNHFIIECGMKLRIRFQTWMVAPPLVLGVAVVICNYLFVKNWKITIKRHPLNRRPASIWYFVIHLILSCGILFGNFHDNYHILGQSNHPCSLETMSPYFFMLDWQLI